jgi:hypothetical protein
MSSVGGVFIFMITALDVGGLVFLCLAWLGRLAVWLRIRYPGVVSFLHFFYIFLHHSQRSPMQNTIMIMNACLT